MSPTFRVVYGHVFPLWEDFATLDAAKRFRRATNDPEATLHRLGIEELA